MKDLIRFIACLALLTAIFRPQAHAQENNAGDTARVKAYLAISDRHYYDDNMDSAGWYCLKAGALARALDYKRGVADFISYYIPVLNRQGKYQEALELATEGLEVCTALGDNSMLAMAYNNLGNQNQYLGDLRSSATNYLNALIFSEGVDTPQRRQRYSNNLASVFLQLEEKSKSYYYANKSYKLAVETSDTLGMASSLVNLASSEILNEKYEEALKHLDQVIVFGKELEDESYVLDGLINKGDVHSKLGRYNTALDLYEQSFSILKNYPVPDYELYVYWGLAKNYASLAKYGLANQYLQKSISVATGLQALQELSKLYLLGSEINDKMREHAIALKFLKQYQAINDSLVGVETQANIHRLEIEYQTAQKEKELADKQLIIAQSSLEIEKKDKTILLSVVIAISLLFTVITFIIAYRNKQKRHAARLELLEKRNELDVLNALIEGEEKERSRLARELHDGVGGILSASRMHLSLLQEDQQNGSHADGLTHISSMLDQASQEIRSIAHNLFPDLLEMHPLDVAVGNYCQRVRNAGLNLDYYYLGARNEISTPLKLAIYRSVQELVNNSIKHARASHVLVQLSQHENTLQLTVEDNGAGFDPDKVVGMGLLSLKNKITKLGGQLSIESCPGKGTTVHIEIDFATNENSVHDSLSVNA